jgi:hypothetical protein
VREIVGSCALSLYNSALPQFFERARQALLVPVGGFGQQIKENGRPIAAASPAPYAVGESCAMRAAMTA